MRLLPNCSSKVNRFCDFEKEDLCGYQAKASNGIRWIRSSKSVDENGPEDQ